MSYDESDARRDGYRSRWGDRNPHDRFGSYQESINHDAWDRGARTARDERYKKEREREEAEARRIRESRERHCEEQMMHEPSEPEPEPPEPEPEEPADA